MRILYDEQGFCQVHGGVSRYFVELMKRFRDGDSYLLPVSKTENAYLQMPPFCIPPKKAVMPGRVAHLIRMALAVRFPNLIHSDDALNHLAYLSAVKSGDYDLLHVTSPHPRLNTWTEALRRGHPVVATIHDLTPEKFSPRDCFIRRARHQLLKDAAHIIAVSENTKKDIQELYHVPAEKISVVYHGCSFEPPGRYAQIEGIPSDYLLFVGRRGGYKNFSFVIRALAPLMRSDRGLYLVCTGSAFTASEKREIDNLQIGGQVLQRFIPDDQMPSLFAHALAFISASRYEGFGLPIVDAFNVGCPVILARASCFPEVGGDAAAFFDLDDSDGLRELVVKFRSNQDYRQEMSQRGKNRALLFSWEKCALQTFDIYRNVLAK